MPYGLPCAGYAAFSISTTMSQQIIHVERQGATRTFTAQFWKQLPDHKYGWKVIPAPVPQAVSNNLKATAGDGKKTGAKAKKEAIEAPENADPSESVEIEEV